jgi:hypothetical protein
MNAFPQAQSVLVIDNCCIHHNEALQDLVNGAGKPIMVPNSSELTAYMQVASFFTSRRIHLISIRSKSPSVHVSHCHYSDYAITDVLSVKAYMCHHAAQIRAANDPVQALLEACGCITAGMAEHWFSHSGYA